MQNLNNLLSQGNPFQTLGSQQQLTTKNGGGRRNQKGWGKDINLRRYEYFKF